MSSRWVPVVALVTLALAVACISQSDTADADPAPMVDKPTELGPYPQGQYDAPFHASTKSYDVQLRVFYPAAGAGGVGAPPNNTGAPYPTVVWLPFYGGGHDGMDFQAMRLVSYGAVVVTFGVNWNDFPNSGNSQDMEDLLDLLEDLNATSGNTLTGMVDKEAFGVSGYSSGGGLALVDGADVDRFKAVQTWAAAIGTGTVDSLAPYYRDKPVLLQVGQQDSTYIAGTRRAYQVFGTPRTLIESVGGGHGGPFMLYSYVSFFLHHLGGEEGYRTYLYGDGALEEVAAGNIVLKFQVSDDLFYPPDLEWTVSKGSVEMDENLTFNVTWTGFLGGGVEGLEHQYDVDGDLDPEVVGLGMPNVTYAFTEPGTFQVTYTYRMGAYADTLPSRRVVVTNIEPQASAGPDLHVKHDGTLTLDASGSTDSPSDIERLEYKWEFSDGFVSNFSADPKVSRTFDSVRVVVATLTVRDPHGGEDTDEASIAVENVAPTVVAGWTIDATEDTVLGFSGRGNDTVSHRRDLEYRWDFGDGSKTSWSSDPEVRHAYNEAGVYNVTMMVRDPEGAEGSDVGWVNVSNVEPEADALAPLDGARFIKDTEVEFKALGRDTASDLDGLYFRWDFGDGNGTAWVPWSDADTTHVYTRGGTYTVTLSVVDDDGAEDDAILQVIIVNTPPTAEIVLPVDQTVVKEDVTVTFSGTGTDTLSDLNGLVFSWEIAGHTLVGDTVQYTFPRSGSYEVSLIVTDAEGMAHTALTTLRVLNVEPTLEAQLRPASIEVNGSVGYNVTLHDTPSDLDGLLVEWDFGDGTTSQDHSGTHTYTASGDFAVNLTVTDDDGAVASMSWVVRVSEPPPEQPVEPPTEPDLGEGEGIATWMWVVSIALSVLVVVLAILLWPRLMEENTGPDGDEGG